MAKRRRKYTKKSSKIESIIFLGFLIIIALSLLINLLVFIFTKILSFFEQLDFLGWAYVLLGCVGLYLLFWMSKQIEKRAKEERQNQKQLMFEEHQRRQVQKMKEKNTIEKLKEMNWYQFEEFVKQLFDLRGYDAQLTPRTGDGGKDIILKKGNEKSIVECKKYNSPKVTRPDIQKFHSAIIDTKSNKGYYFTTGEFTKPAVNYCADKPVILINGEVLVNFINETVKEFEVKEENASFVQLIATLERKPTN